MGSQNFQRLRPRPDVYPGFAGECVAVQRLVKKASANKQTVLKCYSFIAKYLIFPEIGWL